MASIWQWVVTKVEDYWSWLQRIAEDKENREKQLVPTDESGAATPPNLSIHAAIKVFDETTFPYNLGSREPQLTGNEEADKWIRDFALFDIDIFSMIRAEQVLPTREFVHKRYLRAQRQSHPDRKGGSHDVSTQLNVANEDLVHMYDTVKEQIGLFQGVLNFVVQHANPPPSAAPTAAPTTRREVSSASYYLLFGAGSVGGLVTVWALQKRRPARSAKK